MGGRGLATSHVVRGSGTSRHTPQGRRRPAAREGRPPAVRARRPPRTPTREGRRWVSLQRPVCGCHWNRPDVHQQVLSDESSPLSARSSHGGTRAKPRLCVAQVLPRRDVLGARAGPVLWATRVTTSL